MKIIALYSPAPGCGKSTACGYMNDATPDSRIHSFAQPMRKMTRALLEEAGVRSERIDLLMHTCKEVGIPEVGGASVRKLMRTLGTEWGREKVSRELWLLIMHQKIHQARQDGMNLVLIDDLRFWNEYALLRNLGASCWKIVRPQARGSAHASDGGLERFPTLNNWLARLIRRLPGCRDFGTVAFGGWDVLIDNNGDLRDLQRRIHDMLEVELRTANP